MQDADPSATGGSGAGAPWSGSQVRESFNGISSVLHYTRAAHHLGLWESERRVIERFLPDTGTDVIEAGCGAGRVTLGLWRMGFRRIHAFDFAGELLDQARQLAENQKASSIVFRCADATCIQGSEFGPAPAGGYGGALFMFNGLMQIPSRRNRRAALVRLHALCRPGAPLIFTTHDRDFRREDGPLWRAEAEKWASGRQDPRLADFGDRCFHDESGEVFIHIPDRAEILADLRATGWAHAFDIMRSELASEAREVVLFSDNCRFWVARRTP